MRISMIATKDGLRYRTRRLKAGDDFEVKGEVEARLFGKIGARRATPEDQRRMLDKARAKVGMQPVSAELAAMAPPAIEATPVPPAKRTRQRKAK
jgi:hypothetical protein